MHGAPRTFRTSASRSAITCSAAHLRLDGAFPKARRERAVADGATRLVVHQSNSRIDGHLAVTEQTEKRCRTVTVHVAIDYLDTTSENVLRPVADLMVLRCASW